MLTVALARPGWTVECACSGEEALQRFVSDPWGFDLLVTDHAMPGVDGTELLRRLRELGFLGEVIVVTGGLQPADAARYREQGAGIVLLKPIDAPRLRAAVNAALCITMADARRGPQRGNALRHRRGTPFAAG